MAAVFNEVDDCEDCGGWVEDVGPCGEFGWEWHGRYLTDCKIGE